jgi:SAM-dependent methyltransferase
MLLPDVHLCIVQPLGYVHSLGFLDQARFFRHQFRRMGAEVSLAKNRLRHDAVNFVFGAHLGFDAALRGRYTCVFVNLEQLGAGGAAVAPAYLALLRNAAVIDYESANVSAYTTHLDDVPLVSFAYAPYLASAALPIEQRPIDILFFGSLNERRDKLIQQVETSGRRVTLLSSPLYGPERDELVKQAKAVLNCHFYESARFEQARAFQSLSLGTPVVSERNPSTQPPVQFEDTVFWVPSGDMGSFFAQHFGTPKYANEARIKLAAFRDHDVVEQYADALAFACGYRKVQTQRMNPGAWRPTQLQIGSGKDYKLGWFNVDILEHTQPDAVLDLSKVQTWPQTIASASLGAVELHPASLDTIYANNVLEHVPDLPQLMSNCLALLREGGEMLIEVPHERAATAWQDPTHVRAMNGNSWIYYADWFWYLGWFEWRFQVAQLAYLDAGLQECSEKSAHFMRVKLVKVATTLSEKMTARTLQAGFGGIPTDLECGYGGRAVHAGTEEPQHTPSPTVRVLELG